MEKSNQDIPPALEGKAQIQKVIREHFFRETSEPFASNATTGQERKPPTGLAHPGTARFDKFQEPSSRCKTSAKLYTHTARTQPWWVPLLACVFYARCPTACVHQCSSTAKLTKRSSKFSQDSPSASWETAGGNLLISPPDIFPPPILILLKTTED